MIKVNYKSFFDSVQKDIVASDVKLRTKAARHLVKVMKAKVGDEYFKGYASQAGEAPGKVSGDLQKGIGYKNEPGKTRVGVGPPAYYAHMLEFGTGDRYYRTKTGKTKFVGKVEPRPFVFPTFVEEQRAVERILKEQWVGNV